MAQLFIANASPQYHVFNYRVAENRKLLSQTIAPGGQIRVSANRGDLSPSDVESIFDQHRKYGLVELGSVARAEGLCPLIASVGKPVPAAKIIELVRHNRALLERRGQEARQAAAVAVNDQIEETIAATGQPDVLRQMEFSVEEVRGTQVLDRGGRRGDEDALQRDLADTPAVGQGVRVTREFLGPQPPARGRGGRAPRQRAQRR